MRESRKRSPPASASPRRSTNPALRPGRSQEMGFRRYVATAGALAIMVVMACAAPAHATVFERGHFTFEESVEEDLCGIDVRRDTTASGHFRTRTGKGDL